MKVHPFTIPVSHDNTIIVAREELPYFYTFLHRHQEIQLTWIIEGTGALVAGTNIHVFRSGDIYFLGANLPHVFKSDPGYLVPESNRTVSALTVFFNPLTALSGLFSLPEMKHINTFLETHKNGFKLPAEVFPEISERMTTLLSAEGIDQLLLFLELVRSLSKMQVTLPLAVNPFAVNISDKEGTRLAHIYDYIIQNHHQPLTLRDVAEQAYMTPHAFCRYFKKHTKYTLVTFLNKVRVNEACKMLMSGARISIADVAYNCGFSSITNFNRVFKTVMGKSPRDYIEQIKIDN